MRPIDWANEVVRPLFIVSIGAFAVCGIVRAFMPPSFLRICVLSFSSFCAMMILGWYVILGKNERNKVLAKFRK